MKTVLLDTQTWDLVLDVAGNIAVASDPYSMAQDAASECRVNQGDLWYDTAHGIPYFKMFLGQAPSLSMLKAKLAAAAALVPGVVKTACFVQSVQGRVVSGQVQVTDNNGNVTGAGF